MDNFVIAVRIANGTFVPVMNTSTKTRRRLVLTTVRDNQTSVQIDLYRGADEFMEGPEYVGSLMIENIEAAPKGDPDITLLVGVDDSDNLNATATDKKSGEYQSLSVSLESIDQGGGLGMPDFELSDEALTLEDLSLESEEIDLEGSVAELSLDDVTLEEDLSLGLGDEQVTDTLAGELEEADFEFDETESSAIELAGIGEFSDESVAFDESFSEEAGAGDLGEEDLTFDEVEEEMEEELEESASEEVDEELVEDDLGDEDFTFDEAPGPADENIFDSTLGAEEEISEEGGVFGEPEPALSELDDTAFESDELGEGGFEETEFEADEFAQAGAGVAVDQALGELDDDFEDDLSPEEFAHLDARPDESELHRGFGAVAQPLAPRRANGVIFVGYIVLALAALGVLTYLIFRLLEGPPAPPLKAFLPLAVPLMPLPRRRRRKTRR